MKKKIVLFLIVGIVILGIERSSFAMVSDGYAGHDAYMRIVQADSSGHSLKVQVEAVPQKAVNVGNKICPVTGEKIDEKARVTYEYKGKIYNFCCAMCIDEFKKDPDTYIKKIEDELKAASEAKSK